MTPQRGRRRDDQLVPRRERRAVTAVSQRVEGEMMQGAIGDDDQPIDARRQLTQGIGQQHVVESRRGRTVEPIRSFDESFEDRNHGRELGAVGHPMDRVPVFRHGDEPRAAAELSFEGFPEPDLEREQRFVGAKRRLQRAQTGERWCRRLLWREGNADLPARLALFQLEALQLVEQSAPSSSARPGSIRRRCTAAMPSSSSRRLFTAGLFESSGVRERSSVSRSDLARIRSVIENARSRSPSRASCSRRPENQ